MSKLWALHPQYLDSARLLREHQSVHKIFNSVIRKVENSKNRFYRYGGYVAWRHYLDASELRLRGMRHESFIDKKWELIPESRRLILYRYSKESILKDIQSLKPRQHRAVTAAGIAGRIALVKMPLELNEMVEKVAREGLPRDCFLI